ncbi:MULTISPECIES: DUF3089 domain-containing protein [unclassified Sphingopyxis]|uniref:DUF3089 domain-containing protein n=1 Tax=unclassified Sphingopyxis TaxID=2614943 RepID=UPI00072FDE93|nr:MULTISPECIES: DUF3089 domain-containing protein [unclassified Sphingopyxis]KTE22320.1 hypothetical protein ATE61_19005 [Sphingopyxis sp. H057]KTE49902.1 hypothetical protein ATE69_19055 [Sphingopyxis sp. H071]KTE51202.1 hypothetical protein ATE64_15125 [Sphingopyxis sp. H073]KTE56454.1 hypothetical protein ATE66_19435 [Sphingopyxis sp. H107]KTE60158.1 hypothetical protein ATE65_19770 [Sphingopyxis sp. H100]
MARKFLYLIAAIILVIFGFGVAYQLNPGWFGRVAFVPSTQFVEQAAAAPNAYDDPAMWFARPGLADDPADWRPPVEGQKEAIAAKAEDGKLVGSVKAAEATAANAEPAKGDAAIFFVHPTSYYSKASWNAPLDDADANYRATLFMQGMASAFGDAGEVWAPRYRQATLGAFLATDRVTAGKAIDAAYRDVEQAFDAFLAATPKNKPIILAGHSQGALHLTTLLRNRIAGTPLAKRIVAAYVIGWPISRDTDMAALGLPACETPQEKGCILSWASFAEPADTSMVIGAYDGTIGFDGRPRAGTRMLCTNPLTGIPDTAAGPDANIGTLKPNEGFKAGTLIAKKVGAKCDDDRGFLLIGDAEAAQNYAPSYVLPGNNYHVFDITLFWANVRADVLRRLAAYEGKPSPVPPPAAPVAVPAAPTPTPKMATPQTSSSRT